MTNAWYQLIVRPHFVHEFAGLSRDQDLDHQTIVLTLRPMSTALENSVAAPSRAPPNLVPIVRSPAHSEDTKSLPARALRESVALFMIPQTKTDVMIVFIAPETAGP